MRSILLLVVSACSIQAVDYTGKQCPCPDGWQCNRTTNTCTRGTDGGPGDRDGDGVLDTDDNCPDIANKGQADEDGDGRGDVCDVCPGDRDDGTDGDGDGVGDVCDPNPGRPIDHIVLFEGFHGGIPAGWDAFGAWRQEGDDIAVVSGPGVASSLALVDPLPNGVTYLVGKVTIGESFDPQGSSNYVGLTRNWDPVSDSSVRCLEGLRTSTSPPGFALRDTGGVALSVELAYPYAVGMVERFQFKRDGTMYTCANATLTVSGSSPVTSAMQELGLRTRSTSASYAWMMLIESQ